MGTLFVCRGVRGVLSQLVVMFAVLVSGIGEWSVSSVYAQETAPKSEDMPVIDVGPVEVRGQRIENIQDIKKELARRPGSNILIEEKQITESRALNLQDVLQFAPGVRFQSRFGADEGQFSIRGTSLRNNFHHRGINILINGIYFGDADGFSDFESIDLLAYERIEVYKGANALRYGANSIGGAINFVPRTGYNASTVQMRMLAGSFGMVSGQVSSGKVSEPFTIGGMNATADYYVSVSGNRQDGFQDHSQQARQRINANVGLQLGTHQEIRAYFLQSNVSEAIPGSLTNGQMSQNRKQAGGQTPPGTPPFFACVSDNQSCNWGRYYNQQRIGLAYHNEFSANQYVEIIPYFSNQYVDHPIFQTIRQDNTNVGGEFRYVNTNQLFGLNHSFVAGFQPRYGNQHQTRFVNINGNIGAMTQNYYARTTYFGAYAEDSLDATQNLTIVVGGRWDNTGRQANVQNFAPAGNPFNPNTPSALSNTQQPLRQFDAINPKVGLVYRTTQTSQLYFNASRAYEAPLNVELLSSVNANGSANTGFLDLDAQRAWQFELGHRGTSANKRYTWDVTVYDLEMKNEILASNITNQSTFQNANGTRHTGVEAGGSMVIAKGLFARGGGANDDSLQTRVAYTWSRFKFTDDVYGAGVLIAKAGNTVAGAPEHNLNMEMRYDHPSGWWIAQNAEYSLSGYYVDYLNTVKNSSYFVLHLKSGWNITERWTFYAEGRNLTNKTYAGSVVVNDSLNRYANVSQGISGYAGLEYKY